MVVPTFIHSTREAEAGGSLSLRTVCCQRETLPQKTQTHTHSYLMKVL